MQNVSRRWTGGVQNRLLCFNGVTTNPRKYKETEESVSRYILQIKETTEDDLDCPYSCRFGFQSDEKILYVTEENFNSTNKGTGHVIILTGTILGCVIVITGFVMSALKFFKKDDLAVENSIYQSYECPLQNQTQHNKQNPSDQRIVLLSNTENEIMYHNTEMTIPCIDDLMAVENYIDQKQGACGNENVQVDSANILCFRKRNSISTIENTEASSEPTGNKQLKIKGKQISSAMTNYCDLIIQENQSMNYADVVFDGRSSSQAVVIRGINDRTIYADIDITAVGTSLPENSQPETVEDDDDDDYFMFIDEIVDSRKSKKNVDKSYQF